MTRTFLLIDKKGNEDYYYIDDSYDDILFEIKESWECLGIYWREITNEE